MVCIVTMKATTFIAITAFLFFALPMVSESATIISYQTIPLPDGTNGPVCIEFDPLGGGPYTGICDGRIIRYSLLTGFQNYATTVANRNSTFCDGKNATVDANIGNLCGRPMGMKFNRTGYLFVCDAYSGLYVVKPGGGQATLLLSATGDLAIKFCNGLDVDPSTGVVFFVTSSAVFRLDNVGQSIGSGDRTGRLISYNPRTGQAVVLATDLFSPRGCAVAGDGSYVLFTEFLGSDVKKYYLTSPKARTIETILPNIVVPGNIKRTLLGDFGLVENPQPFVHNALRIDGNGVISLNLSVAGPYTSVERISEFDPLGLLVAGTAYIGSTFAFFVGRITGTRIF